MRKEDVLAVLEMQEPFKNGVTYENGIGKKINEIENEGYSYKSVHTEEVYASKPREIVGAYGFFDETNFDTWFPKEAKVLTFSKDNNNRYCIVLENGEILPFGLSRARYYTNNLNHMYVAKYCLKKTHELSEKYGINISPVEYYALFYKKNDFDALSVSTLKDTLLYRMNHCNFDVYHEMIECGAMRSYDAADYFFDMPSYRNSNENGFNVIAFSHLACQVLHQTLNESAMFVRADVLNAFADACPNKELAMQLKEINYKNLIDKVQNAQSDRQAVQFVKSFYLRSVTFSGPFDKVPLIPLNQFIARNITDAILTGPDKLNIEHVYDYQLLSSIGKIKSAERKLSISDEAAKKITSAILKDYLASNENMDIKDYLISYKMFENKEILSALNNDSNLFREFFITVNDLPEYATVDFQLASAVYNKDKDAILSLINEHGSDYRYMLKHLPEEYRNDKDIVLAAVEKYPYAFKYASKELRNDKNFVLAVLGKEGNAVEEVSESLRHDRDVAMAAVVNNGCSFIFLPEEFKADKEIALTAVRKNGSVLEYASSELQANKEVVLEAVKNDGWALKYASPELQDDKEVVEARRQHGMDWTYKEAVLEAVKQDGLALRYASPELKADKEVVFEAVKQKSWALEYASRKLQADKEVVLEAVKNDGCMLRYASPELQSNEAVVLEAVKQAGAALGYVSSGLPGNKIFVLEAVRQNGNALEYASYDLQSDKDVVIEAVRQKGYALEYASDDLQSDKEVVIEAVRQNGNALEYASDDLQSDKEVVLEAVKQDGRALRFASREIRENVEKYGIAFLEHPDNYITLKPDKVSTFAPKFDGTKRYADMPEGMKALRDEASAIKESESKDVQTNRPEKSVHKSKDDDAAPGE